MLDVYRNYYGLTGEPFRLGPDHRFSLHHESYANAKAYLDYAIFQGEGFIAITGGPGTGKTTLISEILAGLDRDKVQVATLSSTQLESRDLLYMVASSFDLHPEDASKANLLVEIESFLVRRLRDGQRAILIVDEAQGLSEGALEELRQLANLQYRYQLLLQIFLIGQEQLLDLIRAPAMEHLRQRLVAATSLEPLSFDETIDYIEHRLGKVGWTDDPAIDEGALREIYRYSGGIPRRINLIANRLFLHGGMEKKHRFREEDAKEVIRGLIDEFLLAPEPPIVQTEFAAAGDGKDARPRSLPRAPRPHGKASRPKTAVQGNGAHGGPEQGDRDRKAAGDRPAGGSGQDTPRRRASDRAPAAPQPARRSEARKTPAARRATPPPPHGGRGTGGLERPVPSRPAPGSSPQREKKGGGKGMAAAVLVLAGLGVAYLLRDQIGIGGLEHLYRPVEPVTESAPLAPAVGQTVPQQDVEPPGPELSAAEDETDLIVESATTTEAEPPVVAKVAGRGEIIRERPSGEAVPAEPEETVNTGITMVPEPEDDAAGSIAPRAATSVAAAPVEAPVEEAEPLAPEAERHAENQPEALAGSDRAVQRTPPAGDDGNTTATLSASAAASDTQVASAQAELSGPDMSDFEARRLRLRQSAEQRFAMRQAREKKKAKPAPRPVPVAKVPPKPAVKAPVEKPQPRTVALSKPAPVRKKPRFSPQEMASRLLKGGWSSRGKPASLLPSDTTFCKRQGANISCTSIPRTVNTQYGPARYKVETTLSGFSPQGHFEMSYRTLVKLVKDDSGDSDWQVTDYSMSCSLTRANQVSCIDGKGVKREYRRSGPGTGR